MSTPFDSLTFYTKLLTGLVLLLNIFSLACIHLLVRWLKNPRKAMVMPSEATLMQQPAAKVEFRSGARAILFSLLLLVIAINGLAVYGNFQLRAATDTVIAGLVE